MPSQPLTFTPLHVSLSCEPCIIYIMISELYVPLNAVWGQIHRERWARRNTQFFILGPRIYFISGRSAFHAEERGKRNSCSASTYARSEDGAGVNGDSEPSGDVGRAVHTPRSLRDTG